MDKRTIVLCLILILLVVVMLNRWETTWWEMSPSPTFYATLYQQDRLTSLIHYNAFLGKGDFRSGYQNPYITHGITAFLYLAISVTVIALLEQTNRKK